MSARANPLAACSVLALALGSVSHQPAKAQQGLADVQPEVGELTDIIDAGDIVVTGERLRGQVQVEQAPILELDEADIEGIGANSIVELLEVVAPQTNSSRGRGGGGGPAILVNGLRISSFRELRSYPPEAIRKVEVLSEEVAVKFGFSPNQRVVNLILKENFASREVEVEYEGPSDGSYAAREAEFTLLKLDQGRRLNVNAEVRDTTLLDESERDIIQTPGSTSDLASDPDPAEFRSLVDDNLEIEATVNWTTSSLDDGTLLSLNGTYEREENIGLSGLNSVLLTDTFGNQTLRTFGEDTPLRTRQNSDLLAFGATHTRRLGGFQLTATTDATLNETRTLTDRPFDTQGLVNAATAGTLALDGVLPGNAVNGFDIANNQTIRSSSQITLNGSPLLLPAGEVTTTLDFGLDWLQIKSDDTRSLVDTDLSRTRWEAGANLSVPIARRGGAWGAIGDVTLNFNGGIEELSDFGTLFDGSVGATFGVSKNLELTATYIYAEVAPSLSELGRPEIANFNATVFDFVNGEPVLATVITGGNPDLEAETQRDWKFGANWELPMIDNTRFTAEYIRNKSSDVTSSFPSITEAIEAAFPDRITRDFTGRLTAVDRRPVTFDRTRSERLVFGLSTRGQFGKATADASGGFGRGGRPQAGNDAAAQRGNRPDRSERGADGISREDRQARFAALRERLCADDGLDYLKGLATAVAAGEGLAQNYPGINAQQAARMLQRFSNEDGSLNEERLAAFRTRMCEAGAGSGPSQAGQGGPPPAAAAGGRPAGVGAGRPGGGRGFGRDGRGRYFINLTHSVELENTITISDLTPVLDQLDGETTQFLGFPRHNTRLEAGMFRNGKGVRLSGNYTGSRRINGSSLTGSSDLQFDDLLVIDLRVFVNLGQVLNKQDTFLDNLRVAFRADNVFNARQQVRDGDGNVPLTYQPALLDPTGRFIGIDLRKMF